MDKSEIELADWELVHTWARDVDTRVLGVEIADVMAYDLLRILGALWLEALSHG